jgi:hypothetical protein
MLGLEFSPTTKKQQSEETTMARRGRGHGLEHSWSAKIQLPADDDEARNSSETGRRSFSLDGFGQAWWFGSCERPVMQDEAAAATA